MTERGLQADPQPWRLDDLSPVRTDDTRVPAELVEEVGPARAATLVADGLVYRFQGRPLVMAHAVEHGSEDPVAFLLWIDGPLAIDEPVGRQLHDALEAGGIHRRWVRLTSRQIRHDGANVQRGAIYLRPPTAPPTATTPNPPRVRPPRTGAERAFVAGLLDAALRVGHVEIGAVGGAEAVERIVDPDLLTLAGEPLTSFVALDDAVPIGHASCVESREDELTGEPYVELVDVSVVPGSQRRGVTAALVAAARAHADRLGQPLIGSVVCQADGGHRRILQWLLADGWRIESALQAYGVP